MGRHRIVCTTQEPAGRPPEHAHIVEVGTGIDAASASQRWTLDEVLRAMDRGEQFYTQGQQTGRVAGVEKFHCGRCVRTYIRSTGCGERQQLGQLTLLLLAGAVGKGRRWDGDESAER